MFISMPKTLGGHENDGWWYMYGELTNGIISLAACNTPARSKLHHFNDWFSSNGFFKVIKNSLFYTLADYSPF